MDGLFHDTLKDIYFAEKKILVTLPKMAKAAPPPGCLGRAPPGWRWRKFRIRRSRRAECRRLCARLFLDCLGGSKSGR
jgi:hypothetical protein